MPPLAALIGTIGFAIAIVVGAIYYEYTARKAKEAKAAGEEYDGVPPHFILFVLVILTAFVVFLVAVERY